MIHDAEQALPVELEADVCIAGAGPAGIVLALEMAERGHRVCLLEGGGRDSSGDAVDSYEGSTSGRPYGLVGSRLRWLGGTSNHWGGWVRPLDPVDFADKPHYPAPGWPLPYSALEPWYERAAQWCEVSGTGYRAEALNLHEHSTLLPIDQDAPFRHQVFRFSPPTRFGPRYHDQLEQAENLDCWLHLNAVALEQTDDAVRSLTARTLSGEQTEIRARFFVLAMGGLENPRFLLNQAQVPGNSGDWVGRCFMDHFGLTPGLLLSQDGLHYERCHHGNDELLTIVAPRPELLQGTGLRNACMTLHPQGPDVVLPPEYLAGNPLFSLEAESGAIYHRCIMINEPLPHPDSRVTLSEQRDALGLRRIHLHWHLPAEDFDSPLTLFREWAQTIGQRGLGRVRRLTTEAPPDDQMVGVGYHHIGTTRMSANADEGVVNSDGRCWDRDNLYVAGSSIFPTAGYANPTLTIVALTARLAEHLDTRLGADR